MGRDKGWLYVLFLLISLVFLGVTHRGDVFGDQVFRFLGLPPWSQFDRNEGLHYSAIFGIVMLLVSGKLAIRYFRKRYKTKVGRTIVLICILFFYTYPLVTEQAYYLAHWNQKGLQAVDFLKKDSRCRYQTKDSAVSMECTIRLVNYGGQTETVKIRPIIEPHGRSNGIWSFVEIQYQQVSLLPRSNEVYDIHFTSETYERLKTWNAGGSTISFAVELIVGDRKEVRYISAP